jgi:hypothetical protein
LIGKLSVFFGLHEILKSESSQILANRRFAGKILLDKDLIRTVVRWGAMHAECCAHSPNMNFLLGQSRLCRHKSTMMLWKKSDVLGVGQFVAPFQSGAKGLARDPSARW